MLKLLNLISCILIIYLHTTVTSISFVPTEIEYTGIIYLQQIFTQSYTIIYYSTLLFLIIGLFNINNIIFKTISYIITISIIMSSFVILKNIFNYESSSTILFVEVQHHIPLNFKVRYLMEYVEYTFFHSIPQIEEKPELFKTYSDNVHKLMIELQSDSWKPLDSMNKKQLEDLACDIIFDKPDKNHSYMFDIAVLVLIISGISYIYFII